MSVKQIRSLPCFGLSNNLFWLFDIVLFIVFVKRLFAFCWISYMVLCFKIMLSCFEIFHYITILLYIAAADIKLYKFEFYLYIIIYGRKHISIP